jgi:dihydropteroate synthase
VDTRKAAVSRAALDAGAGIINDISALGDDPDMAELCAFRKAAVVLMHGAAEHAVFRENSPGGEGRAAGAGHGEDGAGKTAALPARPVDCGFYGPGRRKNPQARRAAKDTAAEVFAFLLKAAAGAERKGIDRGKIILDPGIGFGKTLEDNLLILNRLAEICASGYPVLVGLSRKRFVRELTGRDAAGALAGTLSAEAFCVLQGAAILRVHDAAETVDLVRVLRGIGGKGTAGGVVPVSHFSL